MNPDNVALTPMMKQFWELKSMHRDKILLYRMGDFYEMFFDDAVKAAPILGIALTSRNKKSSEETPMCGVPYHSIAGPINRLLEAGLKVAMADQIEDPKLAKGIVQRAVTRVLTPGMVYDPDTLDAGRAHYLASADDETLSFLDSTTGEAFWVRAATHADRKRYLEMMPVAELVLDSEPEAGAWPADLLVSVHGYLSPVENVPSSASRLLAYVESLSGAAGLQTLRPFEERPWNSRMSLSPTVLRHLEIFQTYKGEGPGSLIHAIDRTKTSAGHRLLRQTLNFPLADRGSIEARLDEIDAWRARPAELKRTREVLSRMGDLERRLGKLPQSTCNGRDLLALAQSLRAGLTALEAGGVPAVNSVRLSALAEETLQTLVDEPPLSVKQGHLIRTGVSPDLDEVILLSTDATTLLSQMEAAEREATGISSLKIRYNNVFGYYIEITHLHREKVPAHYQRKQTLANAERYCTEALLDLERKVLAAHSRRSEIECEIYENLRRKILGESASLLQLAHACASLDVVTAWAYLSLERNHVRPRFTEGSMKIEGSRHPVVEQSAGKNFVQTTSV